MPTIVETTVYLIHELPDAHRELPDAHRETARSWYREHCLNHYWYEYVFDDFETICGILGITLGTSPVHLHNGKTRDAPHIYFRGFWSEGDGACFASHYTYAPNAKLTIRTHAPTDAELHGIADALQAVQKRNFYQLTAAIAHRGHHYHRYSMNIEATRDSPVIQPMTEDAEDEITSAFRDLADWLYRQLQEEYEYRSSHSQVDEVLTINEWTFTEHGERFG